MVPLLLILLSLAVAQEHEPPRPQAHRPKRPEDLTTWSPPESDDRYHKVATSSKKGAEVQTAFVFGGNGQIGSAIVQMLLARGYKVTILNRGKDYYHSAQDISPKVTHIQCDRFKGLKKKCPALMQYLTETKEVSLVVDTNAYTKKFMKESTDLFKPLNPALYVFISPDSVYEVCIKRHAGATKESDTERPESKEEYEHYASVDRYGHQKLLAEETLQQSEIPYLILRAPDVIGPRDTTSRFWVYHMWVKYFDVLNVPIPLPTLVKSISSSYVYVPDIVQVLELALDQEVDNEVFNVAFDTPSTLSTLLLEISQALDVPIMFDHDVDPHHSYHLYPSTARGQLDITKAVETLGFKPTPWSQAIRETVEYYTQAQQMFPGERVKVVQALVDNVASDITRQAFVKAVLGDTFKGKLGHGEGVHTEL